MQIQISWLLQKPTDLDLHCLQRQGLSGFSRTRVNYLFVYYVNMIFLFSAGIGRTGVLITMETAICLIEANQPVYPLSIVRQMRDQRAMLIQTPVSYN